MPLPTLLSRVLGRGTNPVPVPEKSTSQPRISREIVVDTGLLLFEHLQRRRESPVEQEHWIHKYLIAENIKLFPANDGSDIFWITFPFPQGAYDAGRLAQGLTQLIEVEPRLNNEVYVTTEGEPPVRIRYNRNEGELFHDIEVELVGIWGTHSRGEKRYSFINVHHQGYNHYDLRDVLGALGKDSSDEEVTRLRERLSLEARLRGVPVQWEGSSISFTFSEPRAVVVNDALLEEELSRRPKELSMRAHYRPKPRISSVTVTQTTLELHLGFSLKSAEGVEGLKTFYEQNLDRLEEAISAATGISLQEALQSPCRVAYWQ